MPLKYVTSLVQRDGKHFVHVHTPLGPPDVEQPTSFEPDDEHEEGPFDSAQEAKKKQTKIEDDLRKRRMLWIPSPEYRAMKKAKEKTKKQVQSKQKDLF